MVEIVWEFILKEGSQGRFELAYGPGGMWSKLFGKSQGFRGTTALRDANNPQRYLTIDLWDSEVQRNQALVERQAEYDEVATAFEEWTESKTEIGTFSVLAQATVRPHAKAGKSKKRGRR